MLLSIIAALLRVRRDLLSAIFAHGFVPLVSVAAAMYLGSGSGPLLTAAGNVTVVELATEITASGEATARPGLGVLVQPEDVDFTLTMPRDVGAVRSSLGAGEVRANRSRIEINREVVVLRAPFRYVQTPALFIVDGAPPAKAGLPGGDAPLRDIAFPARHSPALVVSLLVVVAFSVGLAFAAPGATALVQFLNVVDAAEQ